MTKRNIFPVTFTEISKSYISRSFTDPTVGKAISNMYSDKSKTKSFQIPTFNIFIEFKLKLSKK